MIPRSLLLIFGFTIKSFAILLFARVAFVPAAELSPKQRIAADRLLSLAARGSSAEILQNAIALSQRAKPDQLSAINEYLFKNNTAPVMELAANARFALVLQGHAKSLPKPIEQEVVFSIPIFEQKVSDALASIVDHPLMQPNLPTFESLEAYQDTFWDIHVLENEMRNAYHTANYGQRMANFAKKFQLNAEEKALASADFTESASVLERLSRDLNERKAELRIDLLQLAGEYLYDSDEFRPRLFAARAVDIDGELLIEFLTSRKNQEFHRDRLKEPDLARVLTDEIEQLRQQSGDLLEKSRLFASGLHWWQRGRYGRGSDGNGMLKPPTAMKSPTAAFGLFMPSKPPIPSDPYELGSEAVPQIERRHHYVWSYEYRQVRSETNSTTTRSTFLQPTSKTELSYFW